MKIEIEIKEYNPLKGLQVEWDINYYLKTEMQNGVFVITADSHALREMAIHLLTLSQESVPNESHFHFDMWSHEMQEGSLPFVVQKSGKK